MRRFIQFFSNTSFTNSPSLDEMLLYFAVSALLSYRALSFLIPQLKTADNELHCPTDLSASSWTIFTYTSGISVVPSEEKIAVSAVIAHNNSQFVVLKYCQSEELSLPAGGYCVFKGNADCPRYFRDQALPQQLLESKLFLSIIYILSTCRLHCKLYSKFLKVGSTVAF